jgi:hypothetical protein
MKKLISNSVIFFTVAFLAPQILQAQGTITYLSNLGQPSTGSRAVGTNSWLAMAFNTGNNPGGYILNSIQLEMADATGSPTNFTAMIYTLDTEPGVGGPFPGSSLGTLDGSLSPVGNGIYTYTDDSNITLSPSPSRYSLNGYYFIVLTGGTAISRGPFTGTNVGAYDWSLAGTNSYNPTGGWGVAGETSYYSFNNGLSWTPIESFFPQFAINATAIPEPSSEILLGLGGVFFGLVRWKAKSIR